MITAPKPSLEHVQIRRLARVALVLSSIAALPGLLASLYPLYYLFISMLEGPDGNNWVTPLGLVGISLTGWWLYWTYWREMNNKNRQGKISWLVSALFNGGLLSYQIFYVIRIRLYENASTTVNWFGYGGILVWVLVMTVVSLWVWVLKMRESV
jgi:hypothetical protein